MKGQDTYKEIIKFDFPNMIVRVHIPDLTDEERNIRKKSLYNARANLLKKVNIN